MYILFTADIAPGKMAEYDAVSKEKQPVQKKVGMKVVGQWKGYSGNTNRVYTLFGYDDLAEYQKVRDTRQKNPEFVKFATKIQSLFTNQTLNFITPTELSPMK